MKIENTTEKEIDGYTVEEIEVDPELYAGLGSLAEENNLTLEELTSKGVLWGVAQMSGSHLTQELTKLAKGVDMTEASLLYLMLSDWLRSSREKLDPGDSQRLEIITVVLDLPDETLTLVEITAVKKGFPDVGSYVNALLNKAAKRQLQAV